MLPRKHYREVARDLARIGGPEAEAGVRAINDLLDERVHLSSRVARLSAQSRPGGKSLWDRLFRRGER